MFLTYLLSFLSLILLITILSKLKGLIIVKKGESAENYVEQRLKSLDQSKYQILRDIVLPLNETTPLTQIDFVVVSNFGIFCLEVKAHKGWIFGNVKDKQWTQIIYRHKQSFYNPFRQNYAHTQAIQNILSKNNIKATVTSLVIFPNASKINVNGTDFIGGPNYILWKISGFTEPVYTDYEKALISNILIKESAINHENKDK